MPRPAPSRSSLHARPRATRDSSVDCCLSVRRSYEFRASALGLGLGSLARRPERPSASTVRAPPPARRVHAKIPQRKPTSAQLWPSETRFAVGHANTVLALVLVLVSLWLHDFRCIHSFRGWRGEGRGSRVAARGAGGRTRVLTVVAWWTTGTPGRTTRTPGCE